MEAVPDVSVVIPTRDRASMLAAALDALGNQTLAPERFETIVVDDGSRDSTSAVLERAGAGDALRLRVVHTGGSGPAVARNAGWRAANAPLVAFPAHDCQPAPACP